MDNPNMRPKDEIIEIEGLNLCKCGRTPIAKHVATDFEWDPRCYGWNYITVIRCKCGRHTSAYNDGGAKFRWNNFEYEIKKA